MALPKKYDDNFFDFCELGFVACNTSDEDSAYSLFNAAKVLRPNHSLPMLGFGYLHLLKLELPMADECFTEILKNEPNNDLARAFLGLTKSFKINQKDVGSGLALMGAAVGSDDATIQNAANTGIQFVEKYIVAPNRGPASTQ